MAISQQLRPDERVCGADGPDPVSEGKIAETREQRVSERREYHPEAQHGGGGRDVVVLGGNGLAGELCGGEEVGEHAEV